MTSSRRAGLTLGAAWAVYAVFLFFAYPLTPLAVMAMVVPLMLTGWHARRWSLAASVGLVHGAVLAAVGWTIGAFVAWGPDALPLAMALVVLLSWALALAGWTLRIVHLLRWRTHDLDEARRQIEADAATVEAVYSASAAALVGLDTQGRIVSWNPGASAVFGHPAAKAVGATIDILAAPGHADDCSGRIRYVLDTGREMSTFSGKMRHAEGQVLDVEVRPRSITHANDERGALLTVVDRTREVVLGDEVARQAQQQDRIIHNLDEVLYSVAVPSMHPLMMSRTVEQLTGKDAEDWQDFRAFLDLAHPDDKEAVSQRWEHARSGEKSVLRWRLRTALGSHVWVEDRVVPARDDEGRVVRVDGSIRRIFREVELERQAQRMMRWLDALEPMTGGGAWSVDLRNDSWQWSSAMRRILAMHDEPEHGMDAWRARLDATSAQAFEQLLANPDNPHPCALHVMDDAGQMQPFLMEPWVQRGADGEPIWLYGIVRPRRAKARRTRARKATRPAQPESLPAVHDGVQSAALVPPAKAHPVAIPPGSPLVGQHIGQALARARTAAEAVMTAEEADVLAAMDDAVAQTIEEASQWARTQRTPWATKGIASDDIDAEVGRLVDGAKRQAINAVLAAEQKAAEAAAVRADESARRIQEHARGRIEAAHVEARMQVEEARASAAKEAARAREADQARLAAHGEMERVIAAAQEAKAKALEEAEAGRVQAMQAAQAARRQAKAHEARAVRAEAARSKAEQAHQEALAAAEEAKAHARKEAERARAEALAQAEEAKKVAKQEATKARQAQQALEAAEQARRQALAAAEQAKAHALHEAGKTRTSALKAAQEAQQRADAEAEKARRAEAARAKAEAASQQAAQAAEAAKAIALKDADKARTEALEAAREAQERAAGQAAQAQRAEQARQAAEEARAEALQAAEEATQRAKQEEKARKAAIHEAEQATAKAMVQAEKAMAAARVEAERAEAAQQARLDAEAKVAEALQQAEQAAQQARDEAEAVKAEALEEAKRAQAAARAEAAKAQEAEKALAAALKEAHRARDQAIHEAMKARDEAIRAAEKARDEAVREAAAARDEAMQLLAEAQARVEQAEADAEQAWAEARSQAVAVVAEDQTEPGATDEPQAPSSGEGGPDQEQWTADAMDVVWDDEIGWIPRPRGQQAKDKAEQIKARSWQGGSAPKKGAGPWALD